MTMNVTDKPSSLRRQGPTTATLLVVVDSRLRGNDEEEKKGVSSSPEQLAK